MADYSTFIQAPGPRILERAFSGVPYCRQPWAGDWNARPKWNCETNCCLAPTPAKPNPALALTKDRP